MDATVAPHPFEDFMRENRKIWLPFTERIERFSEKCILVDLLVLHPGYFIGNAIIAKYLQSFLGCDVVGLVPAKNVPLVTALASSFGIDRVIPEPDFSRTKKEVLPAVKQIADQLKQGDLKTTLLGLTIDGLHVGDLVYDTCLRNTGAGEVSTFDDGLASALYATLSYFAHYRKALNGLDIAATVQGHVVYARFGILARMAMRKGATVFGKKYAEAPFTVRHYRTLEDTKTFEFMFSVEEFDGLWRDHRDLAIDGGRKYLAERFAAGNTGLDVMEAFGPQNKMYGRHELTEALALPPERFTVFIMPHVLCDSPHRNRWMLYNDFQEWLIDTINQAVANDKVNWVIKSHPAESNYANAVTVRSVASELIADVAHVAIAPDDLNTAALPELADVVVSAVGTAGAEFPALGIPAVIAGESPFSGLGFANEPKTLEAYRQILATIDELPKPTREQTERSLAYAYFCFELCRVECPLVPPTDPAHSEAYERNFDEYWKAAAELARSFGGFENDRLYANFRRQFEDDTDHLLNFDWLDR